MACQNQYIGKFCKASGGVVLGFVCLKNGTPEISYYDPLTGLPYIGAVVESCSSLNVFSILLTDISGTTYEDSAFLNAPKDLTTNMHAVTVIKDNIILQEGSVSSGFTISGNTMTFTESITFGEAVSIYFNY